MALDEYHERSERAAVFGVWLTPGPGHEHPFEPLDRKTARLRALLALDALVALGIAVLAAPGITGYGRTFSALRIDDGELGRWSGWLQLMMVTLLVVTAVTFLRWFDRAYANLAPLGVTGLRIPRGWAVASWFLPFVNLVLPKEATDDLWRASDPDTRPLSAAWRLRTVPLYLHLWWVATLGALVGLFTAQWLLPEPDALAASGLRVGDLLVVVAHLLLVLSAVLLALVARDVCERQAERVAVLGPLRVGDPRPKSLPIDDRVPVGPVDESPAPGPLVHADAVVLWGKY